MNHIQLAAEAAHEAAHPWYELRDAVKQKHGAYLLAKAVVTNQRVLIKLQEVSA